MNRGLAFHHQENYERALADLQRACALEPQDADSHFAMGRTLAKQRKYGPAVSAIRQALELNPSYVDELEDDSFDELHKLKEMKRIVEQAYRRLQL